MSASQTLSSPKDKVSLYIPLKEVDRCCWSDHHKMGRGECPLQITRWLQSVPLDIRWSFPQLEDQKERHDFQSGTNASKQVERDKETEGREVQVLINLWRRRLFRWRTARTRREVSKEWVANEHLQQGHWCIWYRCKSQKWQACTDLSTSLGQTIDLVLGPFMPVVLHCQLFHRLLQINDNAPRNS